MDLRCIFCRDGILNLSSVVIRDLKSEVSAAKYVEHNVNGQEVASSGRHVESCMNLSKSSPGVSRIMLLLSSTHS